MKKKPYQTAWYLGAFTANTIVVVGIFLFFMAIDAVTTRTLKGFHEYFTSITLLLIVHSRVKQQALEERILDLEKSLLQKSES